MSNKIILFFLAFKSKVKSEFCWCFKASITEKNPRSIQAENTIYFHRRTMKDQVIK